MFSLASFGDRRKSEESLWIERKGSKGEGGGRGVPVLLKKGELKKRHNGTNGGGDRQGKKEGGGVFNTPWVGKS